MKLTFIMTSSQLFSSSSKKKKKTLPHFYTAPTGESHRLPTGHVAALPYWMSRLVALSDNVAGTLTPRVKPETDDKRGHSKQSHVVPRGLSRAWELYVDSPHGPGPCTTQHQNKTGWRCPVNTLTVGPVRKFTPGPFN